MDKFSSEVHRLHMKLEGKPLNSLKIKTQFLESLQSVSVELEPLETCVVVEFV